MTANARSSGQFLLGDGGGRGENQRGEVRDVQEERGDTVVKAKGRMGIKCTEGTEQCTKGTKTTTDKRGQTTGDRTPSHPLSSWKRKQEVEDAPPRARMQF